MLVAVDIQPDYLAVLLIYVESGDTPVQIILPERFACNIKDLKYVSTVHPLSWVFPYFFEAVSPKQGIYVVFAHMDITVSHDAVGDGISSLICKPGLSVFSLQDGDRALLFQIIYFNHLPQLCCHCQNAVIRIIIDE